MTLSHGEVQENLTNLFLRDFKVGEKMHGLLEQLRKAALILVNYDL